MARSSAPTPGLATRIRAGRTAASTWTSKQIRAAWNQGQGYRENPNRPGVHQKFTDEMARKTVRSRICKQIIGESTDRHLTAAAGFGSVVSVAAEVDAEAELQANAGPVLEVPLEPTQEPAAADGGTHTAVDTVTTQAAPQDSECPF